MLERKLEEEDKVDQADMLSQDSENYNSEYKQLVEQEEKARGDQDKADQLEDE